MSEYVECLWNPENTYGLSRKDRAPGKYLAYVPDELPVELPALSSEAQQASEDALAVLARADERIGRDGRYLHHLLIRSESISSSWIEGNRVSPKKLAIAEILQRGTPVALDVVSNVQATEQAIATLSDAQRPITVSDLEDLQHVIEPRLERGIRRVQNWVGGSGWSPLRADFVPPPPSEVKRLTQNLAQFISATQGNPVVRAAIAHAQFETIHPFIDGNGRTGRALIHTVLKRADALRNTIIPISTVFAGDTDAYIAGLTDFRSQPQLVDSWVMSFSRACEIAAENAIALSSEVSWLNRDLWDHLLIYRRATGMSPVIPRRDSTVAKIFGRLPEEPVLTADGVAEKFSVSPAAAHRALVHLSEARILKKTKDPSGRRICWSADDYLSLVALSERSNRIGGGDTKNKKPRLGPPAPPRN